MKKLKKIPKFKTEKEERLFWQKANSLQYVDWSRAERWMFPNLKLTSVPITMRIPESLLDRVKVRAHQRDIPYQTLMKQFIYDGMAAL
jgi:predicted DNA binding CopG/RHH family protein